jgi:hypothetical protein
MFNKEKKLKRRKKNDLGTLPINWHYPFHKASVVITHIKEKQYFYS